MTRFLIRIITVIAFVAFWWPSMAVAQPPLVVSPLTEKKVAELPSGELFWRIETFPTLEQAQAAATRWALVAESAGKVWLFTLGPAGGASAGGTKVAEVGPIPPVTAPEYLLRINEASGPPGSVTPVHTHAGSEAFFVLTGEQSIRSSHGVQVVKAGQPEAGHGAGMAMQVSSSGPTDLHALVMFVVDATKPFSTPATFDEAGPDIKKQAEPEKTMNIGRAAQPDGFLAVPPTGEGSPVLVLHAWWGLNDTMKAFCTRLAESGFVAFAPDLYHGKTADTIRDAEILRNALDSNRAKAEIAAATKFLNERAGQPDRGLAVIGFSMGAYFALDLSVTDPEPIRSVVVFYGTRGGDYSGSKAAYLGHFAETDEFEPQSDVDEMEAAVRHAGRPVTFHRYTGTGHWFFEPDRPQAFNQEAASLAWDRTLAFLRRSSTS